MYDKEREDGVFTPRDPDLGGPALVDIMSPQSPSTPPPSGPWNPLDTIFVTQPPWHPASIASALSNGKADKEKDRVPKNPVSHWRVSKKRVVGECRETWERATACLNSPPPMTDFVFSPDVKYVAAISEDGCLRVIDAVAEQ